MWPLSSWCWESFAFGSWSGQLYWSGWGRQSAYYMCLKRKINISLSFFLYYIKVRPLPLKKKVEKKELSWWFKQYSESHCRQSMWHWKKITLCLYWMVQIWLSVCDQTFNDELEMHPFFWLWLLVYEKEDVGRQMLYQVSGVGLPHFIHWQFGWPWEWVSCMKQFFKQSCSKIL